MPFEFASIYGQNVSPGGLHDTCRHLRQCLEEFDACTLDCSFRSIVGFYFLSECSSSNSIFLKFISLQYKIPSPPGSKGGRQIFLEGLLGCRPMNHRGSSCEAYMLLGLELGGL